MPARSAAAGRPVAARGGSVHSWDLSTGVDGPGTRFVLFLAGCPLRCVYCQNPDTWFARDGRRQSVAEVMRRVRRYAGVYERTGGGLTVSGGEPLLQPGFTGSVLRAAREAGIHTALDTSGALGSHAGDRLLLDTDLVLLDIKAFDPATYRRVTGGEVAPVLAFARRLAALRRAVWLRFVLVPGLNDGPADLEPLADFVAGLGNVARVDVLPFHTLGAPKYVAMGIPFPLAGRPAPTEEEAQRARAVFRGHGLPVT